MKTPQIKPRRFSTLVTGAAARLMHHGLAALRA